MLSKTSAFFFTKLIPVLLVFAFSLPAESAATQAQSLPSPSAPDYAVSGRIASRSSEPTADLLPEAQTPTAAVSLLINEVMFYPAPGEFEWVELKNAGTSPLDIGGYGLTDEDGNWYCLPEALPEVPVGAFVVVVFDGLGNSADDYDFSDNVATVHSPQGKMNIFEDQVDQVGLYTGILYKFLYLPIVLRAGTASALSAFSSGDLSSPVFLSKGWLKT